MLTEHQCQLLEKALTEDPEPRKAAAYLCLHMGLSVAEATSLRFRDIDLSQNTLTIKNSLSKMASSLKQKRFELIESHYERNIPIPPQVNRYLHQVSNYYDSQDCFIISGNEATPVPHLLQNLLQSINTKYRIAETLTAIKLRNAFIRRCLQAGIDICTIAELIGVKQLTEIQKKFSDYITPKPHQIDLLDQYTQPNKPEKPCPKQMNLLILGAGSQGQVVKETAEAIGIFREIAFLDDDLQNPYAIDTCTNFKKYLNRYPIAIPSFGNNHLRAKWIETLEQSGFILPTLIHPMATVSPSAHIAEGTLIEAKAILSTGSTIFKGCIISSAATIGIDSTIHPYTHIQQAANIKKNSIIEEYQTVE